jgi:hypothetical protein
MKMKTRFCLLALLTAALWWMASPFFHPHTLAQQKKVTVLEGISFDTAASLSDNLKAFIGKDLIVHLKSGKTLQGYVKSVGNGLLHLEKLAGRDFYDALIRIEDISTMEAKFRDMK